MHGDADDHASPCSPEVQQGQDAMHGGQILRGRDYDVDHRTEPSDTKWL